MNKIQLLNYCIEDKKFEIICLKYNTKNDYKT